MARSEQTLTPPWSGRVWLLGALFLVVIPHLLRLPLWLSLSCLAAFGWRLLHELRGHDLPHRMVRYLLVFLGIGSVAALYRTLIGPDAGVALLTVMLCLKLLEMRTMRDAMIALFIGYFMVIGGFLFSQSIFMGGYLFLVVLALTAALLALNLPQGKVENYRLYLGNAGKMLLQALPLMVLMFVLFPRLSSPLWAIPEDSSTARTGLSDSIEMGSISNLVESEQVAFRVDFEGEIPAADSLYWRGPVLMETDGRRWERSRMNIQRELPPFEALGETVSYTVTLEPHRRRWLFALDLPLTLPRADKLEVYARPDYQLFTPREVRNKLRYEVSSVTRYRIQEMPFGLITQATELPPERNPRSRELISQWLEEGLDAGQIVQRAFDYFSEQPFYYTRQPPQLGQDPVDEFLFESRRGFCEHYASAFVTLMRAAGIPARLVTGYQGGELNEVGNYLVVRQSNAHAWAEVWLENEGWVRIDPTTAIPPSRVENTLDASRFQSTRARSGDGAAFAALRNLYRQFSQGWDALNHNWNQWVLGFDREKQRELLEKLGLDKLSAQWLIIIMIGLLGAVLALITLFTLLRRPRQADPVLRLYQQFCLKLEQAGLARGQDEGPADFASRVSTVRPDLAAAVRQISRLYIRLRYTPHAGPHDIAQLRRLVRAFAAK